MTRIEESVDVRVPISVAYAGWARIEDFPLFMEGVEEITPVDGRASHWVIEIAGVRREFDARVVEQRLDDLISWQADGGQDHAGVVTFRAVDEDTTRVHLRMDYEPTTLVEKAGGALGLIAQRVRADLERFKEFLEADIFELFDEDPQPIDSAAEDDSDRADAAGLIVETEIAADIDAGVEPAMADRIEAEIEAETPPPSTIDLVAPRTHNSAASATEAPPQADQPQAAAVLEREDADDVPSQASAPTDVPGQKDDPVMPRRGSSGRV
ncbi:MULTISPECIES: SRPBCC family protein [Actinoalloteichus]|uniref:Polyketide cyclase / dehydrase family protein n=1 Tax=Actinoalloteichus fjordicus TaxID=1612552 RepID=A0AAC9PTV1_9PSEU|nr:MULTISPECIES: SRPBCC family protein [Actinoalloteichus]APU16281.1 polyketide cyclase / dehydrase family protein [Actinoalloteichus fjordicus]APU22341.1 polyketide cyclase / dehydrase family protein [Actinoalloteichus sp. GBA129-24]